MKRDRLLKAIFFLALAGTGIALYSYLHNQGAASGEFCTIGENFDCDVVNKGPYSRILGIPVSAIGIGGYLALALAAHLKRREPADLGLTAFLALAATGGLAFSLYLTGIEAFVLETWCLLCLTSQAIILTIFVLTALFLYDERKSTEKPV